MGDDEGPVQTGFFDSLEQQLGDKLELMVHRRTIYYIRRSIFRALLATLAALLLVQFCSIYEPTNEALRVGGNMGAILTGVLVAFQQLTGKRN